MPHATSQVTLVKKEVAAAVYSNLMGLRLLVCCRQLEFETQGKINAENKK